MARSFWKPNIISRQFIETLVTTSLVPLHQNPIKCSLFKKAPFFKRNLLPQPAPEPFHLSRRSHVITKTQTNFLKSNSINSFYLYTGYDHLLVKIPSTLPDYFRHYNIGQFVSTREIDVSHKVKLSKAARKNKAKLVKKKTSTTGKQAGNKNSPVMPKRLLTKKLQK